jgi:hypothetical protein
MIYKNKLFCFRTSTDPSLKEEGGEFFVVHNLFCIPITYRTVSPPGQTLLKEKGREI